MLEIFLVVLVTDPTLLPSKIGESKNKEIPCFQARILTELPSSLKSRIEEIRLPIEPVEINIAKNIMQIKINLNFRTMPSDLEINIRKVEIITIKIPDLEKEKNVAEIKIIPKKIKTLFFAEIPYCKTIAPRSTINKG